LAAHRTVTDPAHAHARQALRARHQALVRSPAAATVEVAQRDLALYDRLFDVQVVG
jgi:hypothetical protein